MENYVPPIENLPTREAVIDSLKSNPGDKTLFAEYRESILEQGLPATIETDMEVAKIYREAGLLQEALDHFNDTWDRVVQDKNYDEAYQLRDELGQAIWDLEDELADQS